MDPLGAAAAILQISRNAYTLWQYINNVFQGAKVIDATVSNLASEVKNLAESCDLVRNELQEVLTKSGAGKTESQYDRDGRFKQCIDQQVASCERTLDELWKLVEKLWPGRKTFVEHVSKQIDLQGKKEQIDELRKRIKAHSNALHTTLLIVSIQVAHIAPEQATQQLQGKLDDLQRSLTTIESKLDVTRWRKNSIGDDATLVDFARETLRSGKTLCEGSTAGGSVYGNDSVIGGVNAADANKGVAEWLKRVDTLEKESQEDRFFEPSAPSVPSHDENINTASGAASDALAAMNEDDAYDSDDEDLIEIGLAQAAWNSGFQSFDAADWTKASGFLQNALHRLEQLPRGQWKGEWDIFELQYRLAVCSYHTGNIIDAEAGLDRLSQHELSSNDQRLRLCNARHLLARIYVKQNKLDRASKACRSTLKARYRLQGPQHEDCFESIALMSQINRLRNDDVNAELYAKLIPESVRATLLVAVSKLQPLQASPPGGTQSALLDQTAADLETPSAPASPTATNQLNVPIQSINHGESPLWLSPDHSPKTLSPLPGAERITPQETPTRPQPEQKSNSIESAGLPKRSASFATTSSRNSENSWVKAEPNIPHGPSFSGLSKRASVPIVPGSPKSSYQRTQSTAGSIMSVDESTEETYLPLRESSNSLGSSLSPSPMSRSDRKAITRRFNIEPMHNLDEAICNGELERAKVLTNAVYSGSTQLGNAANSIVFKANNLHSANKSPALHLAVLFGDLDLIKPLIKNGFSSNFSYRVSDEPGMRDFLTPLDLAFASRNEPIIRVLMAHGALLDPSKGVSPCRQLMAPASLQMWPPESVSEVISILELMLSSGWPVARGFSRQDNPSPSPTFLHQACSIGAHLADFRLPLVNLLLDRFNSNYLSVPATETPLHHAIRHDDHDVVVALLRAQRSFRLRNMLDKPNKQGLQPLYLAIRRAIVNPDLPLDIVQRLLDQGASLDDNHTHHESRRLWTSKKSYSTARSIALESGREDLVKLVQLHKDKRADLPQTLARSRTASDDGSKGRAALPHMFVLK